MGSPKVKEFGFFWATEITADQNIHTYIYNEWIVYFQKLGGWRPTTPKPPLSMDLDILSDLQLLCLPLDC